SEVETGQAVAAQDQRDLAAVVEIVLDQVPDDPLPGEGLGARRPPARELDGQIVRCPTPQTVVDHRPRPFETLDDLGGGGGGGGAALPGRARGRARRGGGGLGA